MLGKIEKHTNFRPKFMYLNSMPTERYTIAMESLNAFPYK